jgi:MFS family permease
MPTPPASAAPQPATPAPRHPETAAKGLSSDPTSKLTYTKAALFTLFFWLLWGDFCFTLLENCFQPILQFKLQNDLEANPMVYGLFLTQLPGLLTFFMAPTVSVRSDRHRGRWGRRIPFLLGAAPFACALLALLGFGNEIGACVHARLLPRISPGAVAIMTFGLLFLLFHVANIFLNTIFYYLFNDVVPRDRFVKFSAYMAVVSQLAHMFFQRFIYGYTDKHGPLNINLSFAHWPQVHGWPHWPAWHFYRHLADDIWYPKVILVSIAALFLVAFTFVCLKVKEPAHPPPAPLPPGQSQVEKLAKSIRLLATECFGHRFFLLLFIAQTFDNLYTVLANWQQPMLKSMGIDLPTLGFWASCLTGVSIILMLIAAEFGDRWHPMPLTIIGNAGLVLTAPIALLFLIPGLKPETYMWIRIAYLASHIPINLVCTMANRPLSMRLLPRDRYGQFAASAVMVRTLLSLILGSALGSGFMLLMRSVHHCDIPLAHLAANDPAQIAHKFYFTRYNFVWQMFFQVINLFCYILLYREWKRLGGKEHYKPPIIVSKPPPDAISYRIVARVAAMLFPLVATVFLLVPAFAPLGLFRRGSGHVSLAFWAGTAQARVALASLLFFVVVGWLGLRASARVRYEREVGMPATARAASDRARRWLTFVVGAGLVWLVVAAGWYAWFAAFKN